MAFKQVLEDTLSLFSIPQFLGMSGWRLWLGRVFQIFRSSTCCGRFFAVLYHVVSRHPALACSAIISFWEHQAKSCGLEGSFEHPGVHYQHDTHTSACTTCCGGSFLLTVHLGIEELVAIPSSGMAPGTCVHASSRTIDSSVDPENFHPAISSFEPLIPSFQPRQQHSLLDSAVSPVLESFSVCCHTKAGGLSLSQKEVNSLSYTS